MSRLRIHIIDKYNIIYNYIYRFESWLSSYFISAYLGYEMGKLYS